MRKSTLLVGAMLTALWVAPVAAEVQSVQIEALDTEVGGTLGPRDSLLIRGFIRNAGSVTSTTPFEAATSTIDLTASWLVGTDFRLVGVNIDLADSGGTVIGSDSFKGTVGGHAISTLRFTGLTPGASYNIVLTGVAQAAAVFTIAVSTPSRGGTP